MRAFVFKPLTRYSEESVESGNRCTIVITYYQLASSSVFFFFMKKAVISSTEISKSLNLKREKKNSTITWYVIN